MLDPARPGAAWILTARATRPRARRSALERAGARVIPVRKRGGHLDLARPGGRSASSGVNELLVEGGGGLAAALLRAGLVDRMHFFLAPLLIGGTAAPVLGGPGGRAARATRCARALRVRRLGPGSALHGGVVEGRSRMRTRTRNATRWPRPARGRGRLALQPPDHPAPARGLRRAARGARLRETWTCSGCRARSRSRWPRSAPRAAVATTRWSRSAWSSGATRRTSSTSARV